METMNSREESALARRAPLGVESTGLPATVTRARTRSASVAESMSSASAATGSSPANSGSARTRERQRAYGTRPRRRGRSSAGLVAGRGHRTPPTRSRLPDVHDVHEPARQGAELLGAGTDSPLASGARRASEG